MSKRITAREQEMVTAAYNLGVHVGKDGRWKELSIHKNVDLAVKELAKRMGIAI